MSHTWQIDVTVLAVACNNVVALRRSKRNRCLECYIISLFFSQGSEGKSLFDSLKRINVASKVLIDSPFYLVRTCFNITSPCRQTEHVSWAGGQGVLTIFLMYGTKGSNKHDRGGKAELQRSHSQCTSVFLEHLVEKRDVDTAPSTSKPFPVNDGMER